MMEKAFPQELIDAANRMKDAVNLHVVVSAALGGERQAGFLAIRLDTGAAHDGGTLYDTRRDAVRHTQNESAGFFYTKVGAETMSEREALIVLQMARQAHKNGVVFAETEPVVPMLSELALPYIPNTLHKLSRGIILPTRRNSR
jgi:hypothetical protein